MPTDHPVFTTMRAGYTVIVFYDRIVIQSQSFTRETVYAFRDIVHVQVRQRRLLVLTFRDAAVVTRDLGLAAAEVREVVADLL